MAKPDLTHGSTLPGTKVENSGSTSAGRLSAAEFNELTGYIQENSNNLDAVNGNAVFGVRMQNQVTPTYPDENGIVTLASSTRSLTVYVENNQLVHTFYSKADAVINIAAVAYNGSQNLPYPVVITVYRHNGTAYEEKTSLTVTGSTDSLTYTTLDLSEILDPGTNSIKLSAYCGDMELTSEDLVLSIGFINISVTPTTTWNQLINVQDSVLTLSYTVTGDLNDDTMKKVLYVKLYTGSQVSTSTSDYKTMYVDVNGTSATISTTLTSSEAAFIAHGVHMVEAYCQVETVASPSSVIYTSSSVYTRYMFAKNTADENLYLVVQDMITSIDNYTSSKVYDYYIFKPYLSSGVIQKDETSVISATFGLTYTQGGQSSVAAQQTVNVTAGTAYELYLQPEAVSFDTSSPTYYNSYPTAVVDDDDIMGRSYLIADMNIVINNNASIAPNLNPSYVLNPKLYNTENNGHVYNDKDATHAEISSSWDIKGSGIDGYVNNNLRLLAGDTITLTGFKPFSVFDIDSGVASDNKAITLEIDFTVTNITDEDNPMIYARRRDTDTTYKGLVMYPIRGYIYTKDSNSSSDSAEFHQNFQWKEGERTHITINIQPSVSCNYGDNSASTIHTQPLVRVYINGELEREFVYSSAAPSSSWTEDDYQFPYNASLVLGCASADVDIHSIRYYSGTTSNFTSRDILQDYIASQDTTEAKLAVYNRNAITYGSGSNLEGRISSDLVKSLGKNVLIWHGPELKNAVTSLSGDTALTSTNDGYWEIYRYDDEGNLDERHSGTLCATKKIKGAKSQGTTAKTYYYHNIQTKVKPNKVDGTDKVPVNIANIDSDFISVEEYYEGGNHYVNLTGTYEASGVEVDSSNNILVTDGWFSLDGKYRGCGYEVLTNTPFANKLVNKINYASSMQAHLQGGVMSYNDLHDAIVGNGIDGARSAKCVQPFFFFIQDDNVSSVPIFRGLCTFGSGKADDATWGYTDNNGFCMIEGATNNAPLADMRVPWDDAVTPNYDDTEQDGWLYNGTVNIDMDKAALVTDAQGYENVSTETLTYIKNTFNYLYWHNPNIRASNESRQNFISTSGGENNPYDDKYFYWTTDYYLMRYDYVNAKWVDAGFKGSTLDPITGSYYEQRLLRRNSSPTTGVTAGNHNYDDYEILNGGNGVGTAVNWDQTDSDAITQEIIYAYADHAKGRYNGGTSDYGLDQFIRLDSLVFHYAYVNYFICGTDNCSKNTYYILVPDSIHGHIFELHQDDLDTIFMTDNSGNQTRPYYIDRTRPYKEGSTESCYEGAMNVLFNLTELMFGSRFDSLSSGSNVLTIRLMMRSIFTQMQSMSSSIWGFMNDYFFGVQRYFPETAWNEQAMVRYEYPQYIGAVGRDNVRPISQSLGSQLYSEMQYMTRRIIMIASYAGYGKLGGGTTENIGISEADTKFGSLLLSGKSVTFTPTAFQYIYPAYSMGDTITLVYDSNGRARLSPGNSMAITVTSSTNDRVAAILGSNYYTDMGDLGGSELSGVANFSGDRLVSLVVDESSNTDPKFAVTTIDFSTMPNLSTVSLKNCDYTNTFSNLSELKHLATLEIVDTPFSNATAIPKESLTYLDLRGTSVINMSLVDYTKLTTLYVSKRTTSLVLSGCTQLRTLVLESGSALQTLSITNSPRLTSISLPNSIKYITLNTCSALTSICDTTVSGKLAHLRTLSITSCNNLNKSAIIGRFCTDNAPITTLHIDKFTAESFVYSYLDKILSISNVTTGISARSWVIDMYEESTGYGMTFNRKVSVLNKFGNVDSTNNKVYITYRNTSAAATYTVNVSGKMYTRATGSYTYTVNPSTQNFNHFTNFTWSIAESYPTSMVAQVSLTTNDAVSNVLTVSNLGEGNWVKIGCTLTLIGGDTMEVNPRKVYLWNREASLGDFVYADGDYSDDLDSSRTVVGICVYVDNDIYPDETQYKHRRLCVSLHNIALNGTYTYTSSTTQNTVTKSLSNRTTMPWGLYTTGSSATTEPTNAVFKHTVTVDEDTSETTSIWEEFKLTDDTSYSMYNLADLPNITGYGSAGNASPTYYIYSGNYTDYTGSEATFSEGTSFYESPYNTGWGDGFYIGETAAALENRKLTSDLLRLTRDNIADSSSTTAYELNDIVSSSYINTLNIIKHRNYILSDPLAIDLGINEIPVASGNTTELDAVGRLCARTQAAAEANEISSYPDKFYQFVYPAASACYAYEPTGLKSGETLAQNFKVHNWFLPTEGILARMCWYNKQSSTGTGIHYDIFTNAKNNASSMGWENFSTSSYYWSSTEYSTLNSWYVSFSTGTASTSGKSYTYCVRAVAAF